MDIEQYKNIFLDRDGIINDVIIRGEVVSSPRLLSEFILRDDFIQFYEKLKNEKVFYVVTNQPDIKRQLLSTDNLESMHKELETFNSIKEIAICAHDDDDSCNCRKPKPGMINNTIKKHKLVRKDCLMIGDSIKDIKAAYSAKINSVLLKTSYNRHISDCVYVDSLLDLI